MAQVPRGRSGAATPETALSDAAAQARDARFVAVYGGVLCAAACLALVGFVAVGAQWPPAVAMLVFACLLALSVNRAVVFPSEYAATADLAILLAAVVACRTTGAFLGPLVLGLLAGLLDHEHWRARAFSRVAWNAGNRGLAALAAAGTFAGVVEIFGSSTAVLAASAVLAALVGTAVDGGLSVGMAVGRGETLRSARRELLDIDALVLPLGLAGAAVGFLAGAVGWWAVVPPALLLVVAPELVQTRARVPILVARNVLLGAEAVALAAVSSRFVAVPGIWTILGLLVLAVLAGVELVVDPRAPVPVALGLVVVAGALAVNGGDAVFAGVLVAASATTASWWCTRAGGGLAATTSVGLAAIAGGGAAALAAQAFGAGIAVLAVGLAGIAGFALVALLAARGARRRIDPMGLAWAAPVAALVLAMGVLVTTADAIVVAPVAGLVAGAVSLAWCGATPWRSRVLSVRLGALGGRARLKVFDGLSVVAASTAVATVGTHGGATRGCEVVAVFAGGAMAAMAAGAIRQWRFAPRSRACDAAVLFVVALLVAGYPLAAERARWWSPAPMLLALVGAGFVGRSPVARSDAAAGAVCAAGSARHARRRGVRR